MKRACGSTRPFARWGATALATALLSGAAPRAAQGGPQPTLFSGGEAVAGVAAALLLPSELGAFAHGKGGDFVIGWSSQSPPLYRWTMKHRLVAALDYLPWADRLHVRGRAGYRFVNRHVIAGLGGGIDHDGPTWSPELGLKFLHAESATLQPIDLSLHVLVRAHVLPALDGLRGVTVLVGWNLF